MTERRQFRLPDVGEGLTEADIVTWRVKPGDPVTVNQVIGDIETAKAVGELPSPWDTVVAELLVDEGQTVDVGTPIIAVDTATAGGPAPAGPAAAAPPPGLPRPRLPRPRLPRPRPPRRRTARPVSRSWSVTV